MDQQLKSNLTSRRNWVRLLFMVLFAVLLQVAFVVMWALVAVQFLWALITGSDNDKLRRFGHTLATYIFDALRFLTYNTESKPFPFSDWPDMPARREDIVDVEVVEPRSAPRKSKAKRAEDDIVDETSDVVEDIKDEDETGGNAAKTGNNNIGKKAPRKKP